MNQKPNHLLAFIRVAAVLVCMVMAFSITTAGFASQQPLAAVSGLVRDANGPVAGATVRVKATDNKVITDAEGHFVLSGLSADEPVVLTAWAEGFYIGGGQTGYLPGDSDIEIVLTAYSDIDNPDYEWLSAFADALYEGSGENTSCENCHADPNNPDAALPFSEWLKDAHALSAKNSRFLTMYNGTDVAGNQSPVTRYFQTRDYGRIPLRPDPNEPYFGPGYKLDFPRVTNWIFQIPQVTARPATLPLPRLMPLTTQTRRLFPELAPKVWPAISATKSETLVSIRSPVCLIRTCPVCCPSNSVVRPRGTSFLPARSMM